MQHLQESVKEGVWEVRGGDALCVPAKSVRKGDTFQWVDGTVRRMRVRNTSNVVFVSWNSCFCKLINLWTSFLEAFVLLLIERGIVSLASLKSCY
jgi:hypothetical protein